MKHKSSKIPEYKKELIEIFSKIYGDKKLMTEFLVDILTPSEFEALSLRWQVIKRLNKGEDQRSIAGELGLGVSTVTRGSRELRNKHGGFQLMLKKTDKK